MTKVIFVSGFKSICAGTEVTLTPTGVSVTAGCRSVVNLSLKELDALVALGMVRFEEVAERTPFVIKQGASLEKVRKAIAEDAGKFFIDEEYSFYKVETNEWTTSTLLNTASHIGRVVSGFAIPANSTDKKKIHRLTSLNEIYSLGLSKSEIEDAAY